MRLPASVIVMALLLCTCLEVRAQNQVLVPLFPTPDAHHIDPDVPIRIRAPGPIAPHSVSIFHPNTDTRGLTWNEPTVLLYEATPIVMHHTLSGASQIQGTIAIEDPATISFDHGRLRPNTTYTCVVQGVAINGGNVLPDLTFEFRTRPNVPTVRSCTLDSLSMLECDRNITIAFSESLIESAIDPMRIIRVETSGAADDADWIHQPFQMQTDSSGKKVTIRPINEWSVNTSVRLLVTLSNVIGDKTTDREFTTVVRNAGKVSIDVVAVDGRTVPEWINDQFKELEQVAVANTEFYLSSPRYLGDRWQFVRWASADIDLPDTTDVHVTIPCELLRGLVPFTAIVEQIDSQHLVIEIDSGGSVLVFDAEMNLYATVQNSAAISLSDQLKKVVVIAVPKTGFKFKKWISPWKPADGKESSALVVKPPFEYATELNSSDNIYTRRIRAFFEPFEPATQVYRLRADIVDVDADPLFDPNQSIVFTTQREFEEQAQTSRQICVEAAQCWQIVGYSIAQTNKAEFIEPVQRLCVTAELTNPENRIVFFVQRATFFLRVEKVLLRTDNTNDVILSKRTHPEAYVTVEKRGITNAGIPGWATLHAASCEDNGIPFSTYEVMCGDEIRLRVRGSVIRGEIWSTFADLDRYVVPVQMTDNGQEVLYQMVISQDIALFNATDCLHQPLDAPEVRVRACFLQKFGIESIAMKVRVLTGEDRANNTFIERWYDPLLYRDRANDEPLGSHQLEYFPFHGTRIRVKFTLPIDVQSVYAGGIKARSYGNTLVSDLHAQGLDFEVFSANDEHIQFEMRDGNSINTVVFDVCDPQTSPRLQALHGGIVDLTCFASLKSLSGLALQTKTLFTFDRLQLPGFAMSLNNVHYVFDGDNDVWFIENSGDMYFAFYGGDLAINKALHTEAGFQRYPVCEEQQGTVPDDCTVAHSDKDGALQFGQHMLWMQPHWMDTRDYAWFRGAAYDEDCKDENDCWVNRIAEVIYKVRDRAEGYKQEDKGEGLEWENIIPDLIAVGADFLATLLVPDDQDQFLGEASFLESGGDMWGMKTATAPTFQLVHPNVTFTLTGRFYVDKAVIR